MQAYTLTLNEITTNQIPSFLEPFISNLKSIYQPDEPIDILNHLLVDDHVLNKAFDESMEGLVWFMSSFPKFQTEEMIEYFKSLNPSTFSFIDLMSSNTFYQTDDLFTSFQASPNYGPRALAILMSSCSAYQTEELFTKFKEMSPGPFDLTQLMTSQKYQTEEVFSMWKMSVLTASEVGFLIKNVEAYWSKELFDMWKSFNPNRADVMELLTSVPDFYPNELIEMFKSFDESPSATVELMINSTACQTPEMLEYLKSITNTSTSPMDKMTTSSSIGRLITSCHCYQTKEMLDYFKSINPYYEPVSHLIVSCKFCQTPEMLNYYKSLNPDWLDVNWLITECEFCQTEEMVDFYLSLNPAINHTEAFLISNKLSPVKVMKYLLDKGEDENVIIGLSELEGIRTPEVIEFIEELKSTEE